MPLFPEGRLHQAGRDESIKHLRLPRANSVYIPVAISWKPPLPIENYSWYKLSNRVNCLLKAS